VDERGCLQRLPGLFPGQFRRRQLPHLPYTSGSNSSEAAGSPCSIWFRMRVTSDMGDMIADANPHRDPANRPQDERFHSTAYWRLRP
jgi:hypothetical protein